MVTRVDAVKVTRRLDAAKRRQPLQAKVGATMTPDHFNELARQGKIGHMGIGESVAMIAAGLGRQAKPKDVKITLEPVIAERELDSLLGTIQPGQVGTAQHRDLERQRPAHRAGPDDGRRCNRPGGPSRAGRPGAADGGRPWLNSRRQRDSRLVDQLRASPNRFTGPEDHAGYAAGLVPVRASSQ